MLDDICSELGKLAAKVGREPGKSPAEIAYLAISAHATAQAAEAINRIYQPWNGKSHQTTAHRFGR